EVRLDSPAKPQVLTEDGRLAYFTLGPQCAGLGRAPLFAVPDEFGRNVGYAAMQPVPYRFAKWILVLSSVHLGGEQRVIEACRDYQTRERAQPGQSILVAILMQTRMSETSRRPPGKG